MNITDTTGKLYYIGGCVRDELLGRNPIDIYICYEGDAVKYVEAMGYQIIKIQKDIRTARVIIDGEEIDFASTRKEIYPSAGHLPVTTETGCPLKDDLIRRDFTLNSIAKSVKTNEYKDPTGGIEDLKSGILRVHHNNSFIDDPTRIIRGLKFSLRFGFKLEEGTYRLQNEYLRNVNYDMSKSRLKKELVDCFNLNKEEGFTRFIDEGIYKLLTPQKPKQGLVNIEAAVKKYQIKTPWIIYLGNCDLTMLDLTRQERKIIDNYNILKSLPQSVNNIELDKLCRRMDLESVILWSIFCNPDKGFNYIDKIKALETELTGARLESLGIKGKNIGKALEIIREEKIKNPSLTLEDEITLAKKFI